MQLALILFQWYLVAVLCHFDDFDWMRRQIYGRHLGPIVSSAQRIQLVLGLLNEFHIYDVEVVILVCKLCSSMRKALHRWGCRALGFQSWCFECLNLLVLLQFA